MNKPRELLVYYRKLTFVTFTIYVKELAVTKRREHFLDYGLSCIRDSRELIPGTYILEEYVFVVLVDDYVISFGFIVLWEVT